MLFFAVPAGCIRGDIVSDNKSPLYSKAIPQQAEEQQVFDSHDELRVFPWKRDADFEKIVDHILTFVFRQYATDPEGAKHYLTLGLEFIEGQIKMYYLFSAIEDRLYYLNSLGKKLDARKKEGIAKRSEIKIAKRIVELKDKQGLSFGEIRRLLPEKKSVDSIKKLYYRWKKKSAPPPKPIWLPDLMEQIRWACRFFYREEI